MLSQLRPTTGSTTGLRRSPHCRTCGKPMKGHKMALCQLRSPSEESVVRSYRSDDGGDGSYDHSTSPPYSPMMNNRRLIPSSRGVPHYPHKPIGPEPSWDVPEGTSFHRRNPHIANPLLRVGLPSPLHRTASWATTEKAGDSDGEYDGGPTPPTENPDTASGQKNKVDIVDGAGKKVILGVDLSSLGENLKAILHQADQSGFHATVVRPHIGYNRGSVDIRTNADADKHTTIFVSTAPDTMSINLMCSEAFRRTKLVVNDEIVGRPWSMRGNVGFWIVVFLVVFLASLVAAWVNSGVGQLFL